MTSEPLNYPCARSWDDVGDNLFVPEHFTFSEDAQFVQFIAENPMAHVVTSDKGDIRLTNAPIIWPEGASGSTACLWGHMAARNVQSKLIHAGSEAVLLFQTSGAYVSSHHYTDVMTAPTWSYMSVQVRGRFVPLTREESVIELMRQTVAQMEKTFTANVDGRRDAAWTMDALSPEQMDRYLTMITAFEFKVDSIEGIRRLGQDKTLTEMQNIQHNLMQTGQSGAAEICRHMSAELQAAKK